MCLWTFFSSHLYRIGMLDFCCLEPKQTRPNVCVYHDLILGWTTFMISWWKSILLFTNFNCEHKKQVARLNCSMFYSSSYRIILLYYSLKTLSLINLKRFDRKFHITIFLKIYFHLAICITCYQNHIWFNILFGYNKIIVQLLYLI